MRKLGLFLLLCPIVALAASRALEVAFFRDGKVNKFVAPIADGRARVIVEFSSTPVLRSKNRLQSQAAARSTLERFRRDLASDIATESSERRAVIEHEYLNAFSGAVVTLDASTLARVKSFSYVQRVTYDEPVAAYIEPGIAAVRAPEVWAGFGTRGAGITVAIIDTGIDYTHSSLGGGFGPGFKVIGGHDFVNDDDDPMDDMGHGTHVAGTVAGNSVALLGVAPDAKLVAFKVLDGGGLGSASDIIAAIERCIDPNGDGDFSDRVDIANMSLGGFGNPEDPMSRAVDTAVEGGIVFAIAAGNAGAPQSIGSPGTAERAITVGATMPDGTLAIFSSRGPNALHYSIKPDVVAPGFFVRSAGLGGGLLEASGTSMATPHVAGVAALLRALHPDWSVDRIKSAIVSTAQGETQNVMAVGGGSVDAFRATNAITEVQPPSLSFGVTDGSTPSYSRSVAVTITNHGDSARTYTANLFGAPDGITFDLPRTLTLAPGEARQIQIAMQVDHTKVGFPADGTFAFGGRLELDAEGEHVRVPWAVAKGLRVHVTYTESDHYVQATLWRPGVAEWLVGPVSPGVFETLVAPGVYDLAVIALPTSDELDPAVLYFEQQEIQSDRRFDLGYFADAPYVTNFAGHDEAGVPLLGFPEPGGCIVTRTVEFPGNRGVQFSSFEPVWKTLRTNALTSGVTLYANDYCLESSLSRFYSIHFEPVRGVTESQLRFGGGNALIGQKVEVRIPGTPAELRVLEFGAEFYLHGNPGGNNAFFAAPYEPRVWSGMAYMTPEHDGNVVYPPMIAARRGEGDTSNGNLSAVLRVVDGRIASFAGPRPGLTTDYGDLLSIGSGAVIPQLTVSNELGKIFLFASTIGQLEESRRPGWQGVTLLVDEFGGELPTNGSWAEVDDLDRRVTLKTHSAGSVIDGVEGSTLLTSTFGGPQEDKLAPALTSMLLRDRSDRRIIERVQRDTIARVMFAIFDNGLIEGNTSLRVRKGESDEWISVPVVVKGHDERRGTVYEGEVQLQEKGHYDLEVRAEDASGNSTVALLTPVLAVVEGKARAVRH